MDPLHPPAAAAEATMRQGPAYDPSLGATRKGYLSGLFSAGVEEESTIALAGQAGRGAYCTPMLSGTSLDGHKFYRMEMEIRYDRALLSSAPSHVWQSVPTVMCNPGYECIQMPSGHGNRASHAGLVSPPPATTGNPLLNSTTMPPANHVCTCTV